MEGRSNILDACKFIVGFLKSPVCTATRKSLEQTVILQNKQNARSYFPINQKMNELYAYILFPNAVI